MEVKVQKGKKKMKSGGVGKEGGRRGQWMWKKDEAFILNAQDGVLSPCQHLTRA